MKLVYLILGLLILGEVYGQRGGGGGRSRSRSRSSFGSSSSAASRARRRARIQACITKCVLQQSDPVKLAECKVACDPPMNWTLVGGILSVFGGIIGITTYCSQRQGVTQFEKQKERQLIQSTNDFEANTDELNQRFKRLIGGTWEIEYFQSSVAYTTEQFTIDHYPSNDKRNMFGITMRSRDSLGSWKGKGYVTFTSSGPKLLLYKDYDNKKKAGQTGQWKILLYEGQWLGEQCVGKWYFKGWENNPTFSGPFTMRNLKSN